MASSRAVGQMFAAFAAATLMLSACTSSNKSDKTPPSGSNGAVGSNSRVPAGAGSAIASGPGAGSVGPARDTYTPPAKAPYPTTGRLPKPVSDQAPVLANLPGSAKSICAVVGSRTDLRSGGIGMGNFQTAQASFAKQFGHAEVPQLNFYVIPQHAKSLKFATIRIEPQGGGTATSVRTKQAESADAYRYFALVLPIKSPGAYRLTVTSGTDQGCFTVSFAK